MNSRTDRLAAQKAQVALVFQKMLGTEEARAYLIENNFAEANIDRILDDDATRKRAAPAPTEKSFTVRGRVTASSRGLLAAEEQWRKRGRRTADKL